MSFPIKNDDFPVRYVNVYQAGYRWISNWPWSWFPTTLRAQAEDGDFEGNSFEDKAEAELGFQRLSGDSCAYPAR